jgi:hypothetical protein
LQADGETSFAWVNLPRPPPGQAALGESLTVAEEPHAKACQVVKWLSAAAANASLSDANE